MEFSDGDDGIASDKVGSSPENVTTPTRAKVKKICKCPTCGKTFSNKSNLSRHTVVHSGQKNFECQICGNRFFRKSDVNVHMSIHATDKDYKCEVCHKNFSSKSNLTRHKIVHTGQKNFACDLCGKEFFRRSDMNEHMIFHTGEKQFKCFLCAKEFFWQSHLNAHMVAHTGERNHACTICEKKFPSKTNLNRHMVVHSGEKNLRCPECGKEFFWKSQFTEHMVIHTGEKNFKCAICQKEFAHRSTLRKHMRSHLMNEIQCETQMNISVESESEDGEIVVNDGSFEGAESDVRTGHSDDVFEPSFDGLERSVVAHPSLIIPEPTSCVLRPEPRSSVVGTNEAVDVKGRTCSDAVEFENFVEMKEEKPMVIKEEIDSLDNAQERWKCAVNDFVCRLTFSKHVKSHLVDQIRREAPTNSEGSEAEEDEMAVVNDGSFEGGESSVRTGCSGNDFFEPALEGPERSAVGHPTLIIPEPTFPIVHRPEPYSPVVDVKERTLNSDVNELEDCVEIEEGKSTVTEEEMGNLDIAETDKSNVV